MGLKLGQEWKLYVIDDVGTPTTYTLVANVDDLDFDPGATEVQFKSRDSNYRKYKRGQFDSQLTFTVNYNQAEATFTSLEAAAKNGTDLLACVADGDVTAVGTHDFFAASWQVTSFKPVSEIDGPGQWECVLRPSADGADEPNWNSVTVA